MFPSVTALASGGFVVNWHDQNTSDAVAQLFDAQAAQVGSAFVVNSYGAGAGPSQWCASTAALPDGGFWAVWQTDSQDGSGRGVYMQRFDATGGKVGAEVPVNTTTLDSQQVPQIDSRADGSFVVVWSSLVQDGSGWGVYARRYDANGSPQGGELRVNTVTEGDQYNPDVVALDGGRFVVTWETYNGQDGAGHGVFSSKVYDPVSGFNTLGFTGDGADNLIVQPGAEWIDGGAGTDTMQGGASDTTYVVDRLSDVVVESPDGGTD